MKREQTAVEWLVGQLETNIMWTDKAKKAFQQAKEMEKNNTDNKVIHFAEWLTNKHTTTLITLYEQFEEQYYNERYEDKAENNH